MNAPLVEYTTVSASTASFLDNGVTDLLQKGYQLYGSPYFASLPEPAFCQAMIRPAEPKPARKTNRAADSLEDQLAPEQARQSTSSPRLQVAHA